MAKDTVAAVRTDLTAALGRIDTLETDLARAVEHIGRLEALVAPLREAAKPRELKGRCGECRKIIDAGAPEDFSPCTTAAQVKQHYADVAAAREAAKAAAPPAVERVPLPEEPQFAGA